MKRIALPALVLAGTFVLGACTDTPMDPVPASFSQEDPFENRSTGAFRAPAPTSQPIAEIAIGAGFSELVGALAYVDEELDAGLVNLFLKGRDQYTVFAPTNEAFENLYATLGVDGISDLPADLVLNVLFYHVTEGRRAANSVVPRFGTRVINTLLGLTFSVDTNGVITDIAGQEANIVAADISASNGIIHVIDTVILPLD
jgi:uncharacterized surface protein with fasciclin (FAS1) repeats